MNAEKPNLGKRSSKSEFPLAPPARAGVRVIRVQISLPDKFSSKLFFNADYANFADFAALFLKNPRNIVPDFGYLR